MSENENIETKNTNIESESAVETEPALPEVAAEVESVAEEATGDQIDALEQRSKRLKKRILLTLVCIVLGLGLLTGALLLAERLVEEKPDELPEFNYYFYPPYEGDIMQNPQYLALERKVFYSAHASGGETYAISPENAELIDPTVAYVYYYLQIVILGDEVTYNSLFNANYYEKATKQAAFNPQMIYDAQVTYQDERIEENGDRLVLYSLNYKIYQNDGSFRRDIGSDMSRDQLLTLRVATDGKISIENLVTVVRN